MPVHPHTQKKIAAYGLSTGFITLPPVGYPQMKQLLQGCSFVVTDSGGTSREAYFMQKRSLIIMEKPFWPEIIDAGCALQTNAIAGDIITNAGKLSSLNANFNSSIFGNGNAAKNIHQHLTGFFK